MCFFFPRFVVCFMFKNSKMKKSYTSRYSLSFVAARRGNLVWKYQMAESSESAPAPAEDTITVRVKEGTGEEMFFKVSCITSSTINIDISDLVH